jgi:hypothetical protein
VQKKAKERGNLCYSKGKTTPDLEPFFTLKKKKKWPLSEPVWEVLGHGVPTSATNRMFRKYF